MDTNDKAVEKTELVVDALSYAHKNSLNINNKDDVKKILEVLDPQHMSDEEVEEFMKLLQNADTFMEITVTKKESKKTDLPN